MGITFLSPGGDESYGTALFDTKSGTVVYDTTVKNSGNGSLRFDVGATPVAAYVRRSGCCADSGSRCSFWFRFSDLPTASTAIWRAETTTNSTVVMAINLRPTGILAHAPAGTAGTTVLSPNTWYRITVSWVVTSTTSYTFNVYVNGVLDSTQIGSDASLTTVGSNSLKIGPIGTSWPANASLWVDDIYMDNGNTLDDPGPMLCTPKQYVGTSENSTNNAYGVVVGTARSMGSRYLNVSERPNSDSNGWSQTATATAYERYPIQDAATGDFDLTAAGTTVYGYMSWVRVKTAASATVSQMTDNGTDFALSTTTTITPYIHAVTTATYPTGLFGVRSTSSATDSFFYEGGVVFAYQSSSVLSGDAALAGTHSLAADGSNTSSGDGSLAGSHSLHAAGSNAAAGGAALTASHSLTASGTLSVGGAGSLAGAHSLVAGGSNTASGAGSLAGAHSLHAAGSNAQSGSAALSGHGALGGDGSAAIAGSGALAGSHSLGAAGSNTSAGTASLVGSHLLASAGAGASNGSATLVGAHSLVADGGLFLGGNSPLSAHGVLGANATLSAAASASLTGGHSLAAAGTNAVAGSAALAAHGAESAAGSNASAGAAALAGSHTLIGGVGAIVFGNAPLTAHAAGTVTGSGASSGATGLVAHGTLSAAGSSAANGVAGLSGAHSLSTAGSNQSSGAAGLVGHARLTAGGAGFSNGSATLAGHAALGAAGSGQATGSAALAGTHGLVADGAMQAAGSADLSAHGLLSADGVVTVPVVPPAAKERIYDVLARIRAWVVEPRSRFYDVEPRVRGYSVEARLHSYIIEARSRNFDIRSDQALVKKMDPKQPSEVYDFDFTWTRVFGTTGDTIVSATVTASPVEVGGLTCQGAPIIGADPPTVKQWVSGGNTGVTYKLTCRITTTQGRQFEADMQIPVKDS